MASSWKLLSFICLLWWAPSPTQIASPQPVATFPPHGGAYVTSLPAGASAWLDGTYVGETPVYVDDLMPGTHSVTLSRGGWQPETATFDVLVGRATPVSVVMQRVVARPGTATPQQKGQGAIAIRGGPAGTKIVVDGVAAGALPIDALTVEAGYHILTFEPPEKNAQRSTRVVDVYPDTTTVVAFAAGTTSVVQADAEDDVLAPLDSVVPASDVVVAVNDVTIHFQGIEVECAVGSREYVFNGKPGTLAVAPAVVAGRIYIPRSLLQRIAAGK
jgi:hypothetical protein